MWFAIGLLYLCISIPLFIIIYFNFSNNDDFSFFNIYTLIYHSLAEKYNTLGTWIPLVLFIIFCLPYHIIYLTLISILYGAAFMIDHITEIWNKMFGKV